MATDQLSFKAVREKLGKAKYVSILSHVNPDADTLGTALGIYALLLKDKTIRTEVVSFSKVLPQYLDFLPNFKKIKHKMDYENSLVISCDCGNIDRLGFILKEREIINIDHHSSNTEYGNINVVFPEYASTSQVAYALFQSMYPISAEAATCFYAALLSDTQYFTSSRVTEEVFLMAKTLVRIGAKPDEIAKHFTQRKSLAHVRILERALQSLSLYREAKIAFMWVSKDDIVASGATIPDMDGIVDYGCSLTTVEISVFAMELADGIRISIRSKKVDISKIALAFEGGGHQKSAGFVLTQCKLQESIDTILSIIDNLRLIE